MAGYKIQLSDITYGPNTVLVDPLLAQVVAADLTQKGYRRTSNAYCRAGRIDRDDWVHVMAEQLRCPPADFYAADGSGPSEYWRSYYIRTRSNDKITVHPTILRLLDPA